MYPPERLKALDAIQGLLIILCVDHSVVVIIEGPQP